MPCSASSAKRVTSVLMSAANAESFDEPIVRCSARCSSQILEIASNMPDEPRFGFRHLRECSFRIRNRQLQVGISNRAARRLLGEPEFLQFAAQEVINVGHRILGWGEQNLPGKPRVL